MAFVKAQRHERGGVSKVSIMHKNLQSVPDNVTQSMASQNFHGRVEIRENLHAHQDNEQYLDNQLVAADL